MPKTASRTHISARHAKLDQEVASSECDAVEMPEPEVIPTEATKQD